MCYSSESAAISNGALCRGVGGVVVSFIEFMDRPSRDNYQEAVP